jgi:hypothetical protein
MTRSRLCLIGLCMTALSLMAFMTSSASAAEWLILKGIEVKFATELPTTIAGEFEKGTDGTLLAKLIGIPVSVLCTKFALTGAKLEGGGKVTTGFTVNFTGCTVPVPADPETGPLCTVHSPGQPVGTIVSNKLKGQLQTNGEVVIEPESAAEGLAKLVFEGVECPFANLGTQAINGKVWIKDCEDEIQTHLFRHLFEESKAHYTKDAKGVIRLGTLFIGKDNEEHLETYLDGSALAFPSGAHTGFPYGVTLLP